MLYAYVRQLIYRREDALDVMQKIAVVLWKKLDQLDSDDAFRKWSFGVARFEVLAWRRDRARQNERLAFSTETIELMAEELELQSEQLDLEREAILQHCLSKLNKDQRTALQETYDKDTETPALARSFGKRYQKKSDTATLAEEFNKSITGFYQWIYRIRQNLAKCAREMANAA